MAAKRKRQISEDGDEADDGPERQCAVTRQSGDADALIRFVLAPDGLIVPDLERRLPGRGYTGAGQQGGAGCGWFPKGRYGTG